MYLSKKRISVYWTHSSFGPLGNKRNGGKLPGQFSSHHNAIEDKYTARGSFIRDNSRLDTQHGHHCEWKFWWLVAAAGVN